MFLILIWVFALLFRDPNEDKAKEKQGVCKFILLFFFSFPKWLSATHQTMCGQVKMPRSADVTVVEHKLLNLNMAQPNLLMASLISLFEFVIFLRFLCVSNRLQ